ncbi:Rossman fold protein, TIGR00730 family [Actinosynnema sp. ALI-1.44]|uniref:LOG family protein n=1 Tax=Actinosynnema sp. ALI-1.44 TaxID=1933779 RepID=UPI00097C5868|nr:TIGR00730 family Rossman fold protein [Actinosynnema sp. ALI-1.44]ONI77163.1 Rossman fold protein, TIGR00730 family [Actinosynnema sp. ALI-1.44]
MGGSPLVRICVFCGSQPGRSPRYATAAAETGKLLAKRGITLVYGGASVGTMGIVADAALDAGGQVIGVIPTSMVDRELAHQGLTELHVVGSMHERKALMAELSDGFLALPGGAGTLDELFEIWTWAQIGLHSKPIGIVDTDGFYQPLVEMVDHMVIEGFIRPGYRDFISVDSDPAALLDKFAEH